MDLDNDDTILKIYNSQSDFREKYGFVEFLNRVYTLIGYNRNWKYIKYFILHNMSSIYLIDLGVFLLLLHISRTLYIYIKRKCQGLEARKRVC